MILKSHCPTFSRQFLAILAILESSFFIQMFA